MARTHQELDLRSLALHARVAARLREEPALLQIARNNLLRWQQQWDRDDPSVSALREWQNILDRSTLEELCELLVRSDEDSNRLRQSSPFAGILTPPEVWEIKREFLREKAPT